MTTSSPHPLLTVTVAVCHLCQAHTAHGTGPAVILRPAVGPPRPVRLCTRCRSTRPGRACGELVAADWTWAFLEREVAALKGDYESGRWLPYRDELHWVQNLRTTRWTQSALEHALRGADRHLRAGRLARIVEPLPRLLALVDEHDPALRSVRRLLDLLVAGPA